MKNNYKKRLKLISEDIKRVFDTLPKEYMDLPVKGYEDIGTILSNIEIASDLKSEEFIKWKTKFKIPTHDPQTGELNPYYEELTGEKNPLTGEINTKYPPLRFDKEFLTKKQLDNLDDIEYVRKNIMKGLRVPPSDKDMDKMPNQKWHQIISFIKSGVRIIGYCFIPFNLIVATVLLVVSEVIGIVEEMV
jgi:hypothetical protein